jgi:hypothetical protein
VLPAVRTPICQCSELGRERPSPFARRLRPRAVTRGSLTPYVPDVSVLSALSMSVVCVRAARVNYLNHGSLMSLRQTSLSIIRMNAIIFVDRCYGEAITQRSLELCSAPCKARRFAPTTRVVCAWPSGLDVACAPLTGSNCVMASLVLRVIFRRLLCQEIARTCVL